MPSHFSFSSKKLFLIIFLVLLFLSSISATSAQVDPVFFVVDIPFSSEKDLSYLASRFDIWEVDPITKMVKAQVSLDQLSVLSKIGFLYSIDRSNTNLINSPLKLIPGQDSGIPGFTCYRTVEETYTSAQILEQQYPSLATWLDIGDSWEKLDSNAAPGYDLQVLKLTNQTSPFPKAKIFIMSGLHARELAPVELNTRFAEHLLTNYNSDPDITWMLDHNEIYLLLIANPDGRKIAETGLSWRKNTNANYCLANFSLRGADLNRNFPFHWADATYIPGECEPTYFGPSAVSEPETAAIHNYVLDLFTDQRGPLDNDPAPSDTTGMFIDLHSYGELVLWPYGFDSTSTAPNQAQLKTLGYKLAYFNTYIPQQASQLYPAPGASDDFVYGYLGIGSYTIEMGTNFYQDCAYFESIIYPTNRDALLYAIKAARTPYLTPSGPDAISLSIPQTHFLPRSTFQLNATINGRRYYNSSEYTGIITKAQYTIDLPPWDPAAIKIPMVCSDGTCDSRLELVAALVDTTNLSPGRHIIFVQGKDVDGYWGSVSAIFFNLNYEVLIPFAAQ